MSDEPCHIKGATTPRSWTESEVSGSIGPHPDSAAGVSPNCRGTLGDCDYPPGFNDRVIGRLSAHRPGLRPPTTTPPADAEGVWRCVLARVPRWSRLHCGHGPHPPRTMPKSPPSTTVSLACTIVDARDGDRRRYRLQSWRGARSRYSLLDGASGVSGDAETELAKADAACASGRRTCGVGIANPTTPANHDAALGRRKDWSRRIDLRG